MLDAARKIYNAQELPGEWLVQPLKQFHGFFAKRIEESSGLKQAALVIANLFTGIIGYSVGGLLAGLGVLVKLTGVRQVAGHNHGKKAEVTTFIDTLKSQDTFVRTSLLEPSPVGWQKVSIKEFNLTAENADSQKLEILQEIDNQSTRFQKIYYDASGVIRKREGSMTFKLQVMERV